MHLFTMFLLELHALAMWRHSPAFKKQEENHARANFTHACLIRAMRACQVATLTSAAGCKDKDARMQAVKILLTTGSVS
jgi:hypothetical protein